MEFFRQEYRNGLLIPTQGDLPNPGIKPTSPALEADSLPSEPPGKSTQWKIKHLSKKGYKDWQHENFLLHVKEESKL